VEDEATFADAIPKTGGIFFGRVTEVDYHPVSLLAVGAGVGDEFLVY